MAFLPAYRKGIAFQWTGVIDAAPRAEVICAPVLRRVV
jgi:hypothetical protein